MNPIDQHIFRAYDIRGRVPDQLNAEACTAIAQAFGSELIERTGKESPVVCVGRDARTHGPELQKAVINGLLSTGCNVLDIGQTASPINYFTVCTQELDGGLQVTASHNPAHDNGIKLCTANAHAFAGNDIIGLSNRIKENNMISGKGSKKSFDATTPYIEFVTKLFAGIGEGKTIVVDGGNGVAGPVVCTVLRALGAKVVELYTEPDGTFPNHAADPSKWDTLAELQERVATEAAHLGFAFDGDGDRVGLVDERGNIRTADEILLMLAKDHLSRHPGMPVVCTVSNSGVVLSEVEAWGGKPVLSKVGHSHVEHAMLDAGALLGGEQSGHFFCGEDYFTFDDALVAALRILAIVHNTKQPCSVLCAEFPTVFQAQELRPYVEDKDKAALIEKITAHYAATYPVETMDGVRVDLGDGAWFGIRQSNTSPCISICMEARSKEALAKLEQSVLDHLRTYPEIDWKR